MNTGVNTEEYWDRRFETDDWEKNDGRGQSTFFARTALDAFPAWLKEEMNRRELTVGDWGCAEGDGTALLARQFPGCSFTGIDFAEKGLEKARKEYPFCTFRQGNIYEIDCDFDIVFSSNTLEHMLAPRQVLASLVKSARRHAVLLLPLHEENASGEHFCTFREDFFPLHIDGYRLSYFRVIDCDGEAFWSGEQLLLIYSSPAAMEDMGDGTLADLFSNEEYERLRQQYRQEVQARRSAEETAARLCGEKETLAEDARRGQQAADSLVKDLMAAAEREKKLEADRQALAAELRESFQKIESYAAAAEDNEILRREMAEKIEAANRLVVLRGEELQKLTEQQDVSLAERDRAINAMKERNEALLRGIRTAANHLEHIIGSRLYKLAHFISRFYRQGLRGSRGERKNFRRWFKAHLRGENFEGGKYNPLCVPYEILRGLDTDDPAAPAAPAAPAPAGALAEHIAKWAAELDAALAAPLTAEAKRLRSIIAKREYKGILVYPHVVFWEPLQTPQQLLRSFAREGWLCFFCESVFLEDACARELEPNLFLTFEPDLLQALGDTPVTVLHTWMGSKAFVDRVRNKTVWYHILDHLEIFGLYDSYYQQLHEELMNTAEIVSYVAGPLKSYCGNRPDAFFLPNGVNAAEVQAHVHPGRVPEDLAPVLERGHKVVGYYGYLAEWMDYSLVAELAKARPEYEFVFIGKAIHDTSLMDALPNVHLLGLKPYAELFDYAQHFDAAWIPFRVDEKMDCVSPIKFYEYLALGLPVVSSRMTELLPFAAGHDFICCAEGRDEFLWSLDRCLEESIREHAAKQGPILAAENDWLARARRAEQHLLRTKKDILAQPYSKEDVIVLSIIDYDFRHQRPQHFARRMARQGHRVFYVNTAFLHEYRELLLEENLMQVNFVDPEGRTIHIFDWILNEALMQSNIDTFIAKNCIRDAVVLVDYPNWVRCARYLKEKYGFRIVTDYMDDFTGFLNPAAEAVRDNCFQLLRQSDAVVASSVFLRDIAAKYNTHVSLVRNGTEYAYFHKACGMRSGHARPVIGYYGAIADWFNVDVVCRCAERFPECDIVLVGEVSANRERLAACGNIRLVGEVPYKELLPWLASFDVCLIPFDTSTDLIRATNPVKFYEYLSAGKKIVATEIPELMDYRNRFVYLENDPDRFCDRVAECLAGEDTLAAPEECFAFARENDWDARAAALCEAAEAVFPLVSIIVLCYNQLDHTKKCVESILNRTAYPNYELIIVDNCSADGTAEYLRELEKQESRVRVQINETNRGFAGGNNDGLRMARGEYFVLLNNDTIVTRGWLTGMLRHYRDGGRVGLVGPLTNSIGNEARIPVTYRDEKGIAVFAYDYTQRHIGEEYPHQGVLAMFCLMISRDAYETIGELDESFGVGMFEDDDYSLRALRHGFDIVMAEDVFIHHAESASFKKMDNDKRMTLYNRNREYFESKWHMKWKPHHCRT